MYTQSSLGLHGPWSALLVTELSHQGREATGVLPCDHWRVPGVRYTANSVVSTS